MTSWSLQILLWSSSETEQPGAEHVTSLNPQRHRNNCRLVLAGQSGDAHEISNSPQFRSSTVKTYSQLFVRLVSKHKITKSYREVKKRDQKIDKAFKISKSALAFRQPLAPMAQGLSPGALPPPPPAPEEKKAWEENLGVRLICKDCRIDPPSLHEDHASGDLICADCGLVLQARCVDTSSEWRTFANDDQGNDDPSRVGDGPNLLLNGSQLHTSIAYGDGGIRSKDLNRAQNRSTLDKGNKALLQAYKQISSLGETWQVPSIVTDTAKLVYKSIDESRLFKGKNIEAVCASVLFFACRKHNISRTFREAMDLTRVSKKEIGRTFKQVKQFIDHHHNAEQENKVTMLSNGALAMNEDYNSGTGSKDATELCPRFCSNLNLDQQTTNVVSGLVENIKEDGVLDGRSPLSLVAACIYMACQLMGVERSPKEIGRVVNVSDSTIRGAYKFIWKTRHRVVTEDLIAKGANLSRLVDLRSQEEKTADTQKENAVPIAA